MGDNPLRSASNPFSDGFPVISSNSSSVVDEVLFDYNQRSSSLGFMDLLNTHDFGHSLFDLISPPPPPIQSHPSIVHLPEVAGNTPATPNCSSVSSESNDHEVAKEAAEKEDESKEEDEEEGQKTQKHLKSKKTIERKKKKKEQRFAFMTKSEVDHLEDGYRWRKYGQKAVKNSSFPRSYYKCTTASCNVKKRVERSFKDPSIVVTTYEGKHTHPSTAAAPLPAYPAALSYGGSAPFPPELMLLSAAQQTHFSQFH